MQEPQVIQILQIVAPTVIAIVFIVASAAVAGTWFAKRAKRLAPQDAAAQARIEEGLRKLYGRVDGRLQWASVRDQARFVLLPYAQAATKDEERSAAEAMLGLLEGFATGPTEGRAA